MCTREKLKIMIDQIAEFSRHLFGEKFHNVILYGSYARGDYDEESDIDIMIMVDMPPEELRKHKSAVSGFIADLNLENDVFMVSKLQSIPLFNEWKDTVPFYQNVIKDGVIYA